jgi:surface antigen
VLQPDRRRPGTLPGARGERRHYRVGLIQTTLESTPDGATRRWTNQQTGNSGEITPLRTYVSEGGYFCRDYREELDISGNSGRFYHTACRDDSARWVWL